MLERRFVVGVAAQHPRELLHDLGLAEPDNGRRARVVGLLDDEVDVGGATGCGGPETICKRPLDPPGVTLW